MSGLEVAGLLLGAFPLIISGLEHWREVAKVGGFFWRVRREYTKCRSDVRFYELLYKRNLEELLLPIVDSAEEVTQLVSFPGGDKWSSRVLQERLEQRLQESYDLYMEIIQHMNDTAMELKGHLAFNKGAIQSKLASPEPKSPRPLSGSQQQQNQTSKFALAKSKWDYETFRLKFSLNEQVRNELFDQFNKYNRQLEKLLNTSDKVSALQRGTRINLKQTSSLESIIKKASKKSDLLFKALQQAWQCACQQDHVANIRLEHRTIPDIYFQLILVNVSPSIRADTLWSWRELRCGQQHGCSASQTSSGASPHVQDSPTAALPLRPSVKQKQVSFSKQAMAIPTIELDPSIKSNPRLCQVLGRRGAPSNCLGVIGHEDEAYHVHPFMTKGRSEDTGPVTLDHILSMGYEERPTRRQRYTIALLLASSVAQLQSTSWLSTGLRKEEVLFFPCEDDHCSVSYHEPFIRQGFAGHCLPTSNAAPNENDFYALGIILLELCYGQRLEDHPFRRKYPAENGEANHAYDVLAALKWSKGVGDEGGDDYASAVKWCFSGANVHKQSWRGAIIQNVIKPLEMCQEHFKTVAVS